MNFITVAAVAIWTFSYPTVQYEDNYDGDTITFSFATWPMHWTLQKTRVVGMDTPEIRGKCAYEKTLARKARDRVKQLLTGTKAIRVIVTGTDKYGRALVSVYVDGKSLAAILISEGFARSYGGGTRLSWCHTS